MREDLAFRTQPSPGWGRGCAAAPAAHPDGHTPCPGGWARVFSRLCPTSPTPGSLVENPECRPTPSLARSRPPTHRPLIPGRSRMPSGSTASLACSSTASSASPGVTLNVGAEQGAGTEGCRSVLGTLTREPRAQGSVAAATCWTALDQKHCPAACHPELPDVGTQREGDTPPTWHKPWVSWRNSSRAGLTSEEVTQYHQERPSRLHTQRALPNASLVQEMWGLPAQHSGI